MTASSPQIGYNVGRATTFKVHNLAWRTTEVKFERDRIWNNWHCYGRRSLARKEKCEKGAVCVEDIKYNRASFRVIGTIKIILSIAIFFPPASVFQARGKIEPS